MGQPGRVGFLVVLFCLACSADPDLPSPSKNLEPIPSGSFVIPMDNQNQNLNGGYFNERAYGLIAALLDKKIPVKWAIATGKVQDGIDFTANASLVYPYTSTGALTAFRAGPFIVTTSYLSLDTINFISSYSALWNVAIFKLSSSYTVDIRYTLLGSIYVGVMNDGGTANIHSTIFDNAGLVRGTHYDVTTLSSLVASTNASQSCFTHTTQPHVTLTSAQALQYGAWITSFLQSGGNQFSQCEGLYTYEEAEDFFSTAGIGQANNPSPDYVVNNSDNPVIQFEGVFDSTQGGMLQDFVLSSGSNLQANSFPLISNTAANGGAYICVGTKMVQNAIGGVSTYLGGHDYNQGTLGQINGRRILLNSIFIPAVRPTLCGDGNPAVDLTISIKVPLSTVLIDNSFDYTVTVVNANPTWVNNVQVFIHLPAGLLYNYSASTSVCKQNSTTLIIDCMLGRAPPASYGPIRIAVIPTVPGMINITATVTSDSTPSHTAWANITVVNAAVDLAITKVPQYPFVVPGQMNAYTITLINNPVSSMGMNFSATNILVTDFFPSQLVLVGYSASEGTYSNSSKLWSVPILAPNAVATLILYTQVLPAAAPGSTIVQSVEIVGADQADSNLANNYAQASVQVSALSISKSANQPSVSLNQIVNFTVTVKNLMQTANQGNVTVSDIIMDPALTYIPGSATVTIYDTYTSGTFEDTFTPPFVPYIGAENDGSYNFSGPWIEVSDDINIPQYKGFSEGAVRITADGYGDSDSLRMAGANSIVQRSADLSGGKQAIVSFDYRRQSMELWYYMTIEFSPDGVNFVAWALIQGENRSSPIYPTDHKFFQTPLQALTVTDQIYMTPDFAVRFQMHGVPLYNNVENSSLPAVWIDNFQIDLLTVIPTTSVSPGTFPNLGTFDLQWNQTAVITYRAELSHLPGGNSTVCNSAEVLSSFQSFPMYSSVCLPVGNFTSSSTNHPSSSTNHPSSTTNHPSSTSTPTSTSPVSSTKSSTTAASTSIPATSSAPAGPVAVPSGYVLPWSSSKRSQEFDLPVLQNVIGLTDDEKLTLRVVEGPYHGTARTVNVSSNPFVVEIGYTPTPGYHGNDSFVYQICKSLTVPICSNSTVTLVIHRPPNVNQDALRSADNISVCINPTVNDISYDGAVLTLANATDGSDGKITIYSNGTVCYRGVRTKNDSNDIFQYTACDSYGFCATNIVNVTHLYLILNDQNITVLENSAETFVNVLAGDSACCGDTIDPTSLQILSPAPYGKSRTDSNGIAYYTPNKYFHGTDSFVLFVCSDQQDGNCGTALVTINVLPVGSPIIAVNDTLVTNISTVACINVTANDMDPSHTINEFSLTIEIEPNRGNGSVSPGGMGIICYSPAGISAYTDSLRYQICGNINCAQATVFITVNSAILPPKVLPDFAETPENTPVNISILANDLDPEGLLDPRTVTIVSGPSNGTLGLPSSSKRSILGISSNGVITYFPKFRFFGLDYFTYQVCDTLGLCGQALVTVQVDKVCIPCENCNDYTQAFELQALRLKEVFSNLNC